MNKLEEIISKYDDVDFSSNLISENDLDVMKKHYNLKIGEQLSFYLLNYGYLGFQDIEFYGINSKQREKSDLVTQTEYLHKYFPKTINYVAFSSEGEGMYNLIDQNDNMWQYNSEDDVLEKLNLKLIDYIDESFKKNV